jgi:Zn-finger nucleic acid-binding protein
MNCPKCKGAMAKVLFEGVEVDRCTLCDGIWFDVLEREHLRELNGAESIDVGKKPADADKPRQLLCPVCHTRMIAMTVHGHPQLQYESCKVCFGAFFDAGEFREYKRASGGVVAFLKGLVGAS